VNNTHHTFTVRECRIRRVAYERCNQLTIHRRIESNRIGSFPNRPALVHRGVYLVSTEVRSIKYWSRPRRERESGDFRNLKKIEMQIGTMSYNWSLKICHNFDNFGGKLEPDSQLVSWLDVCYCRSTSPILWPGDEGPRDFLNPFLYVLLVKTSATFKPNIVGGRSPFCFPSLPLPNPFLPFCLSILSLLLSFPAPSPALEAGSVGVTPGKLFEILHCCR